MTLIGSGAQADVYLYEGKALKVFKADYVQANGRYEAELQDKAYKKGLPVPQIYEVIELNGRVAIVMEYVPGKSIGDMMLENMGKAHELLTLSVDVQIQVHKTNADDFPNQKDKFRCNISMNPYLKNEQRQRLLKLLHRFKSDDRLCHGDFHMLNLIETSQGIKIIDWVDASGGSVAADVCRSYLLYLLYRKEIAEAYLDIYCDKANIIKRDVLAWLPIAAGARLNENVTAQDVELLMNLVDGR